MVKWPQRARNISGGLGLDNPLMTRQVPGGTFDLERAFQVTYFALRWGMVTLAVTFPLLLWWGGKFFHGLELKDSMSAYYLTEMRDWFVGVLFSVAACLYVYKGLSKREDYLLNLAGVFAIGIAVNPLNWHPAFLPKGVTPHGVFAVLFFAMIALACWLCQDDSLQLGLISEKDRLRYRVKYFATGAALVGLPMTAVLINIGVFRRPFESSVYWAEAVSIWVFAFYWHTKSRELEEAARRGLRTHTRLSAPSALPNPSARI